MKKIWSLILAVLLIVSIVPISAVATAVENVEWIGSMNYGTDNNAVYSVGLLTPTDSYFTKEAWNIQVNTSASSWGVYAGQTAIADDILYITGSDGLYKINTTTGEVIDTLTGVGSTSMYYDYLVIDETNNLLFVVQSSKIQVVDLKTFTLMGDYATKTIWNINTLGSYHPAQIHNGYLICNGFSFKINGNPSSAERYIEPVNTVTFGTETVDSKVLKKNYAWSSGAFVGNYFYVTCTDTTSASPTYKHVLLLAVDYTTGEVKYTFDAGLASDYAREAQQSKSISAYNTTGQVAYDENTGYLFWSNRFSGFLFGVKVEAGGGFASEMKTAALSKNTGTVCAPVIANGRLYIAGQGESWGQGGDICVVNVDPASPDFMKEIYATNTGIYKVQSNPLLFKDGTTSYIVVQSYVAPGYLFVLKDTPTTTAGELELLATPSKGAAVALDSGTSTGGAYAFEQIAKDDEGRIYAYNEEGYLFCFQKSEIAVPKITSNLSTARVKNELNAEAEALSVEATLNGNNGTLSYQWQQSEDNTDWSNIEGADTNSYTPSTAEEKTAYYRVAVTNTYNGKTVTVYSDSAWIFSKVYSDDTNIKVVSSTSNNINSGAQKIENIGNFSVVKDVNKPRVWMTPNYAEAKIDKLDIITGSNPSWANPTATNVYEGITYGYRAYWSTTPDIALLPVKVTAENGDSAIKYILVGTTDGLNTVKYAAVLSEPDFVDTRTRSTGKEMNINESKRMHYSVVKYVGGAADETFADVKWSSDNEEVLTVDNEGNVTALKAGVATVTVTHGYATASAKITVKSPMTGVSLNKDKLDLTVDETADLTVTVTPADTTDDTTAVWTSSDESVVKVENGKVIALKAGKATVKVEVGAFSDECEITVSAKQQSNIQPNHEKDNTNTLINSEKDGTYTQTKPENDNTDTTNDSQMTSPKTGDCSNIGLYIMIMAISMLSLILCIVDIKRRKTN